MTTEITHEVSLPSGLRGLVRPLLVGDLNALATRETRGGGVDAIGRLLSGAWRSTLDLGPYAGLAPFKIGDRIEQWDRVFAGDRLFLLLEARRLTFGPDFHFTLPCRFCRGKIEWTISLQDLAVHGFSDTALSALAERGAEARIPVFLPHCERTVHLRLLTGAHQIQIAQLSERSREEATLSAILVRLVEIEGAVSPGERRTFVQGLHLQDLELLKENWETHDIFVQDTLEVECQKCGGIQDVDLPIDQRFFSRRSTMPPKLLSKFGV